MRFPVVYLLAVAGLHAQSPLSGEVALNKLKQKLESLAKFGRAAGPTAAASAKVCAIPLLKAKVPNPKSIDPHMAIAPRSDIHFHIRQVIPPAPACDDGNVLWKE